MMCIYTQNVDISLLISIRLPIIIVSPIAEYCSRIVVEFGRTQLLESKFESIAI